MQTILIILNNILFRLVKVIYYYFYYYLLCITEMEVTNTDEEGRTTKKMRTTAHYPHILAELSRIQASLNQTPPSFSAEQDLQFLGLIRNELVGMLVLITDKYKSTRETKPLHVCSSLFVFY